MCVCVCVICKSVPGNNGNKVVPISEISWIGTSLPKYLVSSSGNSLGMGLYLTEIKSTYSRAPVACVEQP